METCKNCGKWFNVLYPQKWKYKTGYGTNLAFFCSWKCMRERELTMKITLEQKKKAVDIAIAGGDPIEHLRKCGSGAPDKLWYYIKNKLKDSKPELYAQIPDLRKTNGKPDKAEEPAQEEQKEEPKKVEKVANKQGNCLTCKYGDEDIQSSRCKPCVMKEDHTNYVPEKVAEMKSCSTCKYEGRKLREQPCITCISNGAKEYAGEWEPKTQDEPTDEIKITGVHTKIGRFDIDVTGHFMQWDGCKTQYTVDEWKEILDVVPKVLKMFGV